MDLKRIYFVRHAESHMNAQGLLHQYEEGALSEYGVEQARLLAKRFKDVNIEVIVSSPYERAKATAALIMEVVQAPIVYEDLLKEFAGPRETEGKPKDDPEVIRINTLMSENRRDPHWRYSDEETYHELVTRADRALMFLAGRREEHVLCVTHGLFLRIMLAVMLFGVAMSRKEMLRLMEFVTFSNTGVTICEVRDSRWKLITLNDMAHLV